MAQLRLSYSEGTGNAIGLLRDDIADYIARYVRETHVPTIMEVRQLFMIEP